jgi:hypothetical protein
MTRSPAPPAFSATRILRPEIRSRPDSAGGSGRVRSAGSPTSRPTSPAQSVRSRIEARVRFASFESRVMVQDGRFFSQTISGNSVVRTGRAIPRARGLADVSCPTAPRRGGVGRAGWSRPAPRTRSHRGRSRVGHPARPRVGIGPGHLEGFRGRDQLVPPEDMPLGVTWWQKGGCHDDPGESVEPDAPCVGPGSLTDLRDFLAGVLRRQESRSGCPARHGREVGLDSSNLRHFLAGVIWWVKPTGESLSPEGFTGPT